MSSAPCETMNYKTLHALAKSLGIQNIARTRATLCAQIIEAKQAVHGPVSFADLSLTALRGIAKMQDVTGYAKMTHMQLCNEFSRMMDQQIDEMTPEQYLKAMKNVPISSAAADALFI
jgi:hypothetical protein